MSLARFISFEGGEGSGKSTQITLLADWLKERGIDVILTREPGGTKSAESLRPVLLTGDTDRWDGLSELLLLYAGRHDHVERLIKPSIAKGIWVLCDRFADSTMAYQGFGHNLGKEIITTVHKIAIGDFKPDLTLLLDIPVEKGLERAIARRGEELRYEEMDISFHKKLRDVYKKIAEENKDRCQIVNADQSVENVSKDIQKIIAEKYSFL